MIYHGRFQTDGLLSDSVLNFVDVKKQNGEVEFTVGDDFVLAVVEEISTHLKPAHACVISNEYERFVIFPNKVFRYRVTEAETQQKAIEYAASLGIAAQTLAL